VQAAAPDEQQVQNTRAAEYRRQRSRKGYDSTILNTMMEAQKLGGG
jgi:hypothetical protein